MTQEIKEESLDQIREDIRGGFKSPSEIFDTVRELFYDVDAFDEERLTATITEHYEAHQAESIHWKFPTDFHRLAQSFDALIAQKIVCLHNAGYTKSDGEEDCEDVIARLSDMGINAIGYCYYHAQDLARAIDPEVANLYLGFDSPDHDDDRAILIGREIQQTLEANGFIVNWHGTVDQRIEIRNLNWQKVPDGEDWVMDRVINILRPTADQ